MPGEKQHRKIYERDHKLSRSWNPERYDYEEIPVDNKGLEIDADVGITVSIAQPVAEPYRAAYQVKFLSQIFRFWFPMHLFAVLIHNQS